jgi:hypothetical protein
VGGIILDGGEGGTTVQIGNNTIVSYDEAEQS